MTIAYLYYDLLNLYGDSGNIQIIDNNLNYNNIKHKILYLSLEDELDFSKYDLVYIGSGTENNQKIALNHLIKYKEDIIEYINENKYILVTGNSMDLFSKKIIDDKEYEALNIFNFTVTQGKRQIKEIYEDKILGFINNNSHLDKDYKLIFNKNNFYGTYLIGPILPRNPHLLMKLLNKITNKELKYDLDLEFKAYDEFIKNNIKGVENK